MGKLIAALTRALAERRTHMSHSAMSESTALAPLAAPSAPVWSGVGKASQLAPHITALSNLVQAWRKVKANGGGPGVDGESLRDFERDLMPNLKRLRSQLQAGTYAPQKVRRVLVPKASGGLRPLAILTIRDRIVQRAVYDVLSPIYEQKFLDCSFGFREGRSLHDAAARVAQWRDRGRRWVVDGDIKDCFERIDHRLLLDLLKRDIDDWLALRLIEGWLKAQVFNEWGTPASRNLTTGTYQGGVISPLLANVYLHTFDQLVTTAGLALVRYADDWVILCARKPEADAALERAEQALAQLRLSINPYKTRIVHFDQGFRFLGIFFLKNQQYALSPGMTR